MSKLRQLKSSIVFRCLVAPTLLLCAIFREPLFQWLAVIATGVWLLAVLLQVAAGLPARVKKKRRQSDACRKEHHQGDGETTGTQDTPDIQNAVSSEHELFLIRQVNCRITEQLKNTYPMVMWLWLERPAVEELIQGGAFRIRTANTDPFNYAEVELDPKGRLKITMLQAIPLKDAAELASEEKDDLTQDEMLERVDVKTWYRETGEDILCQTIDDLNTQGHKKLLIHEDGSVIIHVDGKEQIVKQIRDFPPRMVWEEFRQMLREDEITAAIQPDGLSLSW